MTLLRSIPWKRYLPALALPALLVLFALAARPAAAAGIVVNTAADNTTAGDGDCTLREAMTNANSDSDTTSGDCAAGSGADDITFGADYTITLAGSQLPVVNTVMTITGAGAANTIIEASTCNPVTLPGGCTPAGHQVFEVTGGGDLKINKMTVRHGQCSDGCAINVGVGGKLAVTDSLLESNVADFFGGAIYLADAQATLTRVTFRDNRGNAGGAVAGQGTNLKVIDSTLVENTAVVGGGLYIFQSGMATVSGSTFDRNQATTNFGGGIFNSNSSTVNVSNSTFSGNSAGAQGGGLANDGSATVTSSTFSGNTTGFGNAGAGGVYASDGKTVNVVSSVLVRGTGTNCTLVTATGTLADDGSCTGATQKTTAEIALGPLQDNGGPTQTHALLPGSSAIDFLASAGCAVTPISGLDQRGEPRNVDIAGTGSDTTDLCDAGAYEYQPPAPTITVIKNVLYGDDPQDFSFNLYYYQPQFGLEDQFELDDDGDNTNTLSNTQTTTVEAGTYGVSEAGLANWNIDAINCVSTDPNRTFPGISYDPNNDGFGLSFEIATGESITCTFTNVQDPPPTATLTIAKVTDPAGGQGFPFTIDPGAYAFDFKWGSPGIAAFQFREPADVAFDAAGNVYVADLANHRISKFQSNGTLITTFGTGPGNGDGFFDLPYGVAVGPDGSVYVADRNNYRIQKFDGDGNYLDQWGTAGSGNGQFNEPGGVAVDAAGFVYVTDYGNDRVQKFTSAGAYVAQWGTFGAGNGQFDHPWGIAVDGAGTVYVADRDNYRIQTFDSAGAYLDQWGSFGSGDGQFTDPFDVTVDAGGNVYVADTANNRIQKFTNNGDFLSKWGSGPGSGDGQLNTPLGLGVNATGQVYVADSFNDRIQVFSPELTTILNDGQTESFELPPGRYRVSELVPAGWTLDDFQCDSDNYGVDGSAVNVTLYPGGEMTCTASNSRPPTTCPADNPNVGFARTSILGVGMGDTKTSKLVSKLAIPNAGDVTALYGQLAAKEGGLFKYVRFIYPNKAFEQVQPATSQGLPLAISWWGAELDPNDLTKPFVTGRWFPTPSAAKKKLPRAFILYPTYQTADEYANAFSTYGGTDNWVAEPGTSGWATSQTFVLEIPETQSVTDVSGQLAIVDNDLDAKGYRVILKAGTATATLNGVPGANTNGKLLDLLSFTLANVPAGTTQIEIELTVDHLPAAERESVALLGATANYACGVQAP